MTSLEQIPHLLHKSAAVVLLAAAGMAFGISSPSAQSASPASEAPTEHSQPVANEPAPSHAGVKAEASAGKPYYIEFRSRFSWDYGHTYIVHGRVGEAPNHSSVAGLSPVGDDATAWVIGHYVPVPAETGWTDGDLEDKYVTSRYRVLIAIFYLCSQQRFQITQMPLLLLDCLFGHRQKLSTHGRQLQLFGILPNRCLLHSNSRHTH